MDCIALSSMSLSADFYLASIDDATLKDKYVSPNNITIPLKEEGEEVVINTSTDLPEDSSELCTLLNNEECKPEYWLLVSKAYGRLGKYDEAIKVVSEALNSMYVPTDDTHVQSSFHSLLAWLYLAQSSTAANTGASSSGLLIKAGSEAEKSLSLDKNNSVGLLSQAVATLSSKHGNDKKANFEKESRLFDRLLRKQPRNCYALLGKAKIMFYRANYLGALKVFQRVLMLNPLLRPDSRIGIGLCYWFLDKKDLAAQAWHNSVLVHRHGNPEGKILTSLAKFDQCYSVSSTDDQFKSLYNEAVAFTESSYKEDPSSFVVQIILASLYYLKGDSSTTIRICDHILELPGHIPPFVKSDVLFWKARCSFDSNDTHTAQKLFSDAMKHNEDNIMARVGYGQCLVLRKRFSDAVRTFEKLQKDRPQSLEVNLALGMLYSRNKQFRRQAIVSLERYINIAKHQHEPISLTALFTVSQLYEDSDITKSLEYLQIARKQELEAGKSEHELSYALLNNIGVLKSLCGSDGTKSFDGSLAVLKDEKIELPDDLRKASSITLRYNIARNKEGTGKKEDVKSAMDMYKQILDECPYYTNAKIRWLLLACVSENKHIKEELDKLLSEEPDNLEVRSFYGWYLKNYGRKHGIITSKGKDLESELHRDTLVKYTSHDLYALISLGNVYCTLAREIKNPAKKQQYYIRSAQLYQKVLSLDPKDVYAAQGVAIIFAETKQTAFALEIFRRARDCLNTESVFINLAHCLMETHQYAKAIEYYKLALDRFGDGKDAHLLNFLSRAWLYRGLKEKRLDSLQKALDYERQALAIKPVASYQYNVAFVQFQLGDFLRKQSSSTRTVDDLKSAVSGIKEAMKSLEELADNKDITPPYPTDDLKLRAKMGDTLIKQLESEIDIQEKFADEQVKKIEEARQKHEAEEKKINEAKQRKEEERDRIEAKMAEERKKLDKEQEEWNKKRLEEARLKSKKNGIDGNEEGKDSKKRKSRSTKEKSDFIVSDEDSSESEAEFDLEKEQKKEEEEEEEDLFGEKRSADDDDDEAPDPKRRKHLLKGRKQTPEKKVEENAEDDQPSKEETKKVEERRRRSQKVLDDDDE